ncbi:hypothetical protein [Egbenema bharatensis]|uniref:hypothetical protein n=1 Tax=Egbenema bharatensis TaxID=3463334 RepID=UPI003A876F66
MIRWKLTSLFDPDLELIASLPVTGKNQAAPLKMEGPKEEVEATARRIRFEPGAFGHKLDINQITAIDVDYLFSQMPLAVEIIEGAEVIAGGYDPEVGDALT